MQVILGAGGAIGNELAKELKNYTRKIWVVGRNPQKINYDDELFVADLTQKEQVDEAVKGAKVAYLIVGLPYKIKVWQKQWPIVMKNTIDACKKTQNQTGLFRQHLHIWNEIPVLITFESDWKKTKSILHEIVTNHAEHLSGTAEKEIFEASKNYMIYYKNLTPIVYTKVKNYGVQLTMRYLCNPRKRRSSENEIWEEVLIQFEKHKDIQLAYPTTRFYRLNEDKTN